MSNITVSPEDCTKCGVCVNICPVSIIPMKEGKLPTIAPDLEDKCIEYRHCEVFCMFDTLKTNFEGGIPVVHERTGPRHQTGPARKMCPDTQVNPPIPEKPPDRKLIEQMPDVIRYSPTAANSRRTKWIDVHDPEKVQKIAALTIDGMKIGVEKRPAPPYSVQYNGIIRRWGPERMPSLP